MLRLILALLASTIIPLSASAQSVSAAASSNGSTSVTTSDKNCKVVRLRPGESPPSGAVSSSVTAGNGHTSASSSGPNSVTVPAGDGRTSSSVTTSGSGSSAVVVGAGTGHCTIYKIQSNSEKSK